MRINQCLTIKNYDNVNNPKRIKYIVIHYVGATGSAESNCRYFRSVYRGASAHYFVGHKGEVWQCVLDEDVAWHCGAKNYKHRACRNQNSIGIEMCCRKGTNGNWYFEDATVSSTVQLVKELMKKYKIPVENVIRHYDVTGKMCPEPFVTNRTSHTWKEFLQRISENKATAQNNLVKSSDLKVGMAVKLAQGATYYDGLPIAPWIMKYTLYVRSFKGDRVVVSTQKTGPITGAVNIKYLR